MTATVNSALNGEAYDGLKGECCHWHRPARSRCVLRLNRKGLIRFIHATDFLHLLSRVGWGTISARHIAAKATCLLAGVVTQLGMPFSFTVTILCLCLCVSVSSLWVSCAHFLLQPTPTPYSLFHFVLLSLMSVVLIFIIFMTVSLVSHLGQGRGLLRWGQGVDYGLSHNYMDAKHKSFLLWKAAACNILFLCCLFVCLFFNY